MDSRSQRSEKYFYTGTVLVGSGLGALFFFINAERWNRIKHARSEDLREEEIDEDSLYFINVLIGVLLLGIFIWSLLRIASFNYPRRCYRKTRFD